MPRINSVEDFWENVDKTGPNGCWLWKRGLNPFGYARNFGMKRVTTEIMPHRIAYTLIVGPIPDGLDLDHAVCRNRACINPEHLEPVTHQENVRRSRVTKLDEEKVRQIRAMWLAGCEPKMIAQKFHITTTTAGRVAKGHYWSDVT